jgi:hypothetical protein
MRRLAVLLLLGACVPDSTAFVPTVDASMPDADPGAVGIRLSISPSQVDLAEGETEQLSVHLDGAPETPVDVQITGITGVADVEPEVLTFDADDWATDRIVTVTAVDDDNADDEDGAITFDDEGEAVARATVPVAVDDRDLLRFVTSPEMLEIDDTGSGDVLVRLDAAPTSDIIVAVSVLDTGAATVDPVQLRFTPDDWSTDQTVHVTGIDDADVSNETTSVELDGGEIIPDGHISLHVIDSDRLNISVTTGSVNINEGGDDGAIGVSLTQDPGVTTIVTLSEDSLGFHLAQTSIQFTSSNWSEVHTIAVIPDDDVDVTNENDWITLHADGIEQDRTVTVTVDDDDTQEILHTVGGSLALGEGGTATFDVSLRWRPATTTTITIDSDDDSSASPVDATVTIEPNDYNVPHEVVITGVQDNDLAGETPHLTLSADDIGTKTINVAITDNDTQEIVLSTTTMGLAEGASSTTLNAKLKFQPPTATAVSVSSNSGAVVVGATTQTLNFSTTNWGTAQAVQLTAAVDSNTVDEQATISFSGGGATNATTVTVDDGTVPATYGWSTWFNQADPVDGGQAILYKVAIPSNCTLDKLGLFAESAGGNVKMALYRDSTTTPNTPGARVAAINTAVPITAAAPTPQYVDVPDIALSSGTYWIAVRVENTVAIGYSSTLTERQCIKSMPSFTDLWPDPLGTSSCATSLVLNLFVVTYQQQ